MWMMMVGCGMYFPDLATTRIAETLADIHTSDSENTCHSLPSSSTLKYITSPIVLVTLAPKITFKGEKSVGDILIQVPNFYVEFQEWTCWNDIAFRFQLLQVARFEHLRMERSLET